MKPYSIFKRLKYLPVFDKIAEGALMLEKILGSKIAAKCMLSLYRYEEIWPSAIANDFKLTKSAVQKQLERFEDAGVLVSKLVGRTRVYLWNGKSPVSNALKNLVKIYYDDLFFDEKESFFPRRRPRAKNKPVLKLPNRLKEGSKS